jgi:hypothetical protein
VLQEKEICTIDTLERESNIYLCTFYDRWMTEVEGNQKSQMKMMYRSGPPVAQFDEFSKAT